STLSVATHLITVSYSGDTNFAANTSATLSQTVNKASTTTTDVSSVNASVFGQSVTFTATITPVAPGAGTPSAGTLTFKEGATVLGTSAVSGAGGTFTTATLSVGTHPITVVFSGDACFKTSTSAVLSQTVNQANTTTTVTSAVNPS